MDKQKPQKGVSSGQKKSVAASVLGQTAAKRFAVQAHNFTKHAVVSKEKARSTLQDLGVYTTTGRLTKKYK
ncbi:MAG: hypothetical protein RIC29_10635 [Rhodospirillaceae bacterium]